jgi:hypothetical protein
MTFLFHLPFYYCVNPPLHPASEGDTGNSGELWTNKKLSDRSQAEQAASVSRVTQQQLAPHGPVCWSKTRVGSLQKETASSRNRLSSAPGAAGAASQRRQVPGKTLPGPLLTSSTNVSEKFSFRGFNPQVFGNEPGKGEIFCLLARVMLMWSRVVNCGPLQRTAAHILTNRSCCGPGNARQTAHVLQDKRKLAPLIYFRNDIIRVERGSNRFLPSNRTPAVWW